MKFRFGRAEVRLSFGVLPLFAALIIAGEGRTLALSVISLLLHELAHAIAARNLGFVTRRISIYPFGAVLHVEPVIQASDCEWIVALAGPLCSFGIASATRLIAHLLPNAAETLDAFVHTNAALALLNLLPAYPLDGGRIAKSLLTKYAEERTARRISLTFTAILSLLLAAAGVYCIGKGIPAWTLLAIAPYLLVSAWIEWKHVRPNAVANVIERRAAETTGAPMRAEIIVIDGSATVGTAMQSLSHRRYTIFRIRTGERTFEADENALVDAAAKYGYGSALKDIFRR